MMQALVMVGVRGCAPTSGWALMCMFAVADCMQDIGQQLYRLDNCTRDLFSLYICICTMMMYRCQCL